MGTQKKHAYDPFWVQTHCLGNTAVMVSIGKHVSPQFDKLQIHTDWLIDWMNGPKVNFALGNFI